MVQHSAVRLISNLKGRERVTQAFKDLKLDTLAESRSKIRHTLLRRFLSREENHEPLVCAPTMNSWKGDLYLAKKTMNRLSVRLR